jgi:hypothetical protein
VRWGGGGGGRGTVVMVVEWGVAWDGTLRAQRQGPEESDPRGGVEWCRWAH